MGDEIDAAIELLFTKRQQAHIKAITRCGSSRKEAVRRIMNLGCDARERLAEPLAYNRQVGGSSPSAPTKSAR